MFYVIGMLWKELCYLFVGDAYILFTSLSILFPLENRLGHNPSCAGKYLHRVGSGIHSFGKYLLSNYSQCQTLFPAESKLDKAEICQEGHTMSNELDGQGEEKLQ